MKLYKIIKLRNAYTACPFILFPSTIKIVLRREKSDRTPCVYYEVLIYSAAKNKSSKPHFMYWTAQLHNAILLRKSAEIKKWFDPCSCWSKTSLHTKNQVPSSKKGNFGFLGLSKKVRNVCGKGQKSKNELTHLHVGQKYPFTQEMRSLAQKQSILT